MQFTVDNVKKFVQKKSLNLIFDEFHECLKSSFLNWDSFLKQERIATYTKHGPLELMPISNGYFYGFKYVNCHNGNPHMNLLSVVGLGVYASTYTGYPLMISEMTILTAIRTACTSALVGKYLMPKGSNTMAIIGNGCQCEFQALAFVHLCGITKIILYDIDVAASEKSKNNLEKFVQVEISNSIKEAVLNAHIITTCTNVETHACLIEDENLPENVHINAIGGDRPGKTELDVNTLKRADVYVEYEPQTRVEGEIQNLPNCQVTEIHELLKNKSFQRSNITVFDSVGFALEDFAIMQYIYDVTGGNEDNCFIPKPKNPKDLFSEIE